MFADLKHREIAAREVINLSYAKINEILGVVDEIAFRINLLAINDAVEALEAAGAGGQDRDFAAVLEEIRDLAKGRADMAEPLEDQEQVPGETVTRLKTSAEIRQMDLAQPRPALLALRPLNCCPNPPSPSGLSPASKIS